MSIRFPHAAIADLQSCKELERMAARYPSKSTASAFLRAAAADHKQAAKEGFENFLEALRKNGGA